MRRLNTIKNLKFSKLLDEFDVVQNETKQRKPREFAVEHDRMILN